ncbi:hypothetical protein QTO34_004662 [Cnephaeus nilssonii]|uniref:NADH dehydrogenase [ubiquinone] 1 beta subcomplex subunit 2, mitochondrial n=1 Tax=Cnephaeus nilssonii TaxID=3371016 RepID=A0AA40LKN6_CNENI|nr:hypothetical protein QTO34_004662 [Eptesicus nilssonii]
MLALTRMVPFARGGGSLFRGLRARAAGSGVRHAGGGVHIEPRYREFPQLTRSQVIKGEFFSATMWFGFSGAFGMTQMLCWVTFHIQILPNGRMKNWVSFRMTKTENVDSTLYK